MALGSPFRERPPAARSRAEPYRRPVELAPMASSSSSQDDYSYALIRPPPSPRDTEATPRRRRRPPMTMKGRILDYGEDNQAIIPRRRPLGEISLDSLGSRLSSSYVPPPRISSPICCPYPSSPTRPFTPPTSSAVGSSDATELLTPHVPTSIARTRLGGGQNADDSVRRAQSWLGHGDLDGLGSLAGLARGSPNRYSGASSSRCPTSSRYPVVSLPSTPPRQVRGLLPGRTRISRIRRPSTASFRREGPSRAADRDAGTGSRSSATGDESELVNYSCCSVD